MRHTVYACSLLGVTQLYISAPSVMLCLLEILMYLTVKSH